MTRGSRVQKDAPIAGLGQAIVQNMTKNEADSHEDENPELAALN